MNGINRKIGAGAVALGVALGSYGIASAASGSGTTTTTSSSATPSAPSTSLPPPRKAGEANGATRRSSPATRPPR